jgi:hypothetical protein
MTQVERRRYAGWLGKRSYRARLKRLGLKHIQEIARLNGRLAGRPCDLTLPEPSAMKAQSYRGCPKQPASAHTMRPSQDLARLDARSSTG